ncbi:MAG: hypothetical protein LUC24_00060, partial [Bacteroidales bacterium]|nr:hypothetical protein [Bacteroidales bacterium]
CPECGGAIEALGAGTQKIEEEAARLFPEARIGRLDGDILQSGAAGREVIRKFAKREIDILIGTQVVTKGFDFENLSLVAVLQADSMLGIRDFRADEKALQTLVQFRGRCGRRDCRGRLVIQTAQPDHPVYKSILADVPKTIVTKNNTRHNKNNYASPNNSYKNRYKNQNNQPDNTQQTGTPTQYKTTDDNIITKLMAERRDFGYPPFTRLVNVSIRHSNEKTVENLAAQLAFDLKDFNAGTPTVPPVEMEDGQFIRTVRITLARDRTLSGRKRDLLRKINVFESRENCVGTVTIDVDPS